MQIDHAAISKSFETGVPPPDHRIFAFAAKLDDDLNVGQGASKQVMRDRAESLLDELETRNVLAALTFDTLAKQFEQPMPSFLLRFDEAF